MAGRVFPGSNEGDPTFTLTDEHLNLIVNDLEPRIQARVDSYITTRFVTLKEQFDAAVKDEHEARNTSFTDHIKKFCDDLPALVEKTVAKVLRCPCRLVSELYFMMLPSLEDMRGSVLFFIRLSLLSFYAINPSLMTLPGSTGWRNTFVLILLLCIYGGCR